MITNSVLSFIIMISAICFEPGRARSLNAANEYSQIDGQAVLYDAAGNLIQDEDDREYVYDEHDRLIEIQAADDTVLAQYAYDGLGRRVSAVLDPASANPRTIRYYYDGPAVIEERDGSDARVRYHVRGGQYVDEHVATYSDGQATFQFYVVNDLYTVVGVADGSGNVIEAYTYGAYGLEQIEGSSGCQPGDLDGDSVIDMADAALLVGVLLTDSGSMTELCAADLNTDGLRDGEDVQPFVDCLLAANCPPPAGGGAAASGPPFTMHGSPVDVLSDGLMLQYNRARYYDLRHGRWLQRDPSGYVDGSNLYESFGSNPLSFVDPRGTDWFTFVLGLGWNPGPEVEQAARSEFGLQIRNRTYGPLQDRAYQRFLVLYQSSDDQTIYKSDWAVFGAGLVFALGDVTPAGLLAEGGTGISTGRFEEAGTSLSAETRAFRTGVGAAETALLALGSSTALESRAAQALEVRFFQLTNGQMRLGLFSKEALVGLLEGKALSSAVAQEAIALHLEVATEAFAAQTARVAESQAAGLFLARLRAMPIAGPLGRVSAGPMIAGTLDTIPVGQRIILRPVEIQFPARGLSAVERELFMAHLSEQEAVLNRLSLNAPADLQLNLLNYLNIKPSVAASRELARAYLPGSGSGLDAAHALDTVAGGYAYEFVGFRSPIQQRIGALWRTRVSQIVPGREHRLVPNFGE